ncbi:MAG: prolyl oligopeptidase family serine peptidase [Saprospiraceae bacterium]
MGIQRFAWSPDGRQIAFIAPQETPEKPDSTRFNNAFEVGSNGYLVDRAPLRSVLWLVDVMDLSRNIISPDSITLATGLYISDLSWSPDGQAIAFTGFASAYSGDSDLSKNYILNIANKTVHPATAHQMQETAPLFAPDGKWLAYSYPREGVPANQNELHMVDVKSGKSINISRNIDREVNDFHWLNNENIILSVQDGVKSGLWLQKVNENGKKLALGNIAGINYFDVHPSGSMILIGREPNRPDELYYKSNVNAVPKKLTDYNKNITNLKLGKREGFTWQSTKGFQPDGVLTYPPDFDVNKKYPLVLYIHGGPTAASGIGFEFLPYYMASKGWIVFQPNYRGSNNLGNAFQSAIANDAAEGPGEDIMTGVNALKQKSYIDSNKIAVSGWSYGGWMTAWMIGRYPDEWVAAMAGAAPVDYTDMYSLSDLNRMLRHAITDSPYKKDNLKAAYEQSPITYFPNIITPTLIMSKTADARVSITGSYKLYNALRDNGIDVQFIAYPGPGHFPSDPVNALDVYKRWTAWLEKYLVVPKP